ncbi:MAG: DNA (cytosine-5-)-methyltransferase [Leptolyngbya sp. SIO1D8]|nr:DNA (cytosine-5-)-methyltransferase [Leptolyngbya sp. SIO1D8]
MSISTVKQTVSSFDLVNQLPNHQKTFVEYFAGIGLVRLGLEKAGWNVVFSNDWAREKYEMYSAYFENAEDYYEIKNIFDVCHSRIPVSLLATASFPCIDLSLAGNLKGIEGEHSSAFWGFIQILQRQKRKPPIVMLENVSGWLTSNQGQDFRLTLQSLNNLGYACDVFALDAAYFVPQSRLRIFVVGIQTTQPNNDILIFARRSPSLTTKTLNVAMAANRDLAWNFLEVPQLPSKPLVSLGNIIENLADNDERWWSMEEVERHLKMMTSINTDHLNKLKSQTLYSYRTMYRRVRNGQQRAELRKDNIAGCLRTARGGSSRQMIVRTGKDTIRMRLMTPREYARLQGVPDNYPLPKKVNQALTGFGDAVCVPVITWIGKNILNPLVATLLNTQASSHS